MNPIVFQKSLNNNIGTQKFFLPFWTEKQVDSSTGGLSNTNDSRIWLEKQKKVVEELFQTLLNFMDTNPFAEMDCIGFIELAESDEAPWKEAKTKDGGPLHYIRYRVSYISWKEGNRSWKIYGVWIAYETNWGDRHRGYCVPHDNEGKQVEVTQKDHDAVKKEGFKQDVLDVPYITDKAADFKPLDDVTPRQTISRFVVDFAGNEAGSDAAEGKATSLEVQLEVKWYKPHTEKALSVDLVVDLGNTRTVALLMEPNPNANGVIPLDKFRQYCRPVLLGVDEDSYLQTKNSLDDAIIESWFLLCKPAISIPVFKDWDIQEKWEYRGIPPFRKRKNVRTLEGITLRKSHMFAEVSPIASGNTAKKLYSEKLATTYSNFFNSPFEQSSPKRYYWYDEKIGVNWLMLRRTSDPKYKQALANAQTTPTTLAGDILYFMPGDGHILENTKAIDLLNNIETRDDPDFPKYPKSSTMTWFLVHILEKAWSQLNDVNDTASVVIPKYIGRVLGTYPSGWTNAEIEKYRARWQQAVDIFYSTHFDGITDEDHPYVQRKRQRKPEIDLNIALDEAVAGQMAFIVSEIDEMQKSVPEWLQVTGKGESKHKTTRIMNIDIGGGTSDIAVIEYAASQNTPVGQAGLTCSLLSKECFSIAGDDIVKDIITRIIVPQLRGSFVGKLQDTTINGTQDERRRVRAVRGCLIPLANAILKKIKREPAGQVSTLEAGCGKANLEALREFIGNTEQSEALTVSYCSKSDTTSGSDGLLVGVDDIVRQRFGSMLTRCACYAYMYDVDYIFISGKPSELPAVRDMIEHYSGLPLDRIISAKDYIVGNWYPFGRINEQGGTMTIGDAKSVTAVGCMLYNALENQRIQGWHVTMPKSTSCMKNEWSVLKPDKTPVSAAYDGELFSNTQDEMEDFKSLQTTAHIGRRVSPLFDYEPVYKFCMKNSADVQKYPNGVQVRFRRSDSEDTLELVEVLALDGTCITEEFELKIWPCIGEEYPFWQDSGLLENGDDDE